MKTVGQWWEEYFNSNDTRGFGDFVKAIRQEAFERCELEAYRADGTVSENTGLPVPTGWGRHVAERIAKVFREEGTK